MAVSAPLSYSVSQRALHWLTVLLVFYNLIADNGMYGVLKAAKEGTSPDAAALSAANLHAYVGFAIVALTVLRLILRVVQGAPEAPAAEPPLFQLAAKIGHAAFYVLLFAMPLLGTLGYYYGNETAGELHGGPLKALLWVLIVGHVAAVLMHKFVWKTNVLDRMTKGVKA